MTKVTGAAFDSQRYVGVSVKDYGAVGDGVTDDTLAFQNWAKDLNAKKTTGYVPGTTSFYSITRPFILLDGARVIGDGNSSHIRNVTTSTTFAQDNACVLIGTYLGFASPYSATGETSYAINSISRGASSVTMDTAADASMFSPGDIVLINDGTTVVTGTNYPKNVCLNEVVSSNSSTGVVTMKYMIADDYSATSVMFKLNNNGVSLDPDITGIQGETKAKIARNCSLENLQLSHADTTPGRADAIHFAMFECQLRNIHISQSSTGISGNLAGHTVADGLVVKHTHHGIEMAYGSNNNNWGNFEVTRIGDGDGINDWSLIKNENGADNLFHDFTIHSYSWSGDSNTASITTACPRTRFENFLVVGAQGAGLAFVGNADVGEARSRGSSARNFVIVSPATTGVSINSNGVSLENGKIIGTPSGNPAVNVMTEIDKVVCKNIVLGDPETGPTPSDYIRYQGTVGSEVIFEGITGYKTGLGERTYVVQTTTGVAAAADVKSYTIPAGRSGLPTGWDVTVSGTVTGTAGAKTIILQCGGANVETLSYAASETGTWWIRARITKHTGNVQHIVCEAFDSGTTGTQNTSVSTSVDMSASPYSIDLNVAVDGAGDTVVVREWSVEPFADQYDTA